MLIQRYEPKSQVITRDDDSNDVYFVLSGQVRATVFSKSGKEVNFQDLGAGEMFGELSAIDGEPRSTHVVTLADSLIASISKEDFWWALLTYPSVARHTLRRLTSLVRSHAERIFEYSTLGVKNRIHAELLRIARCESDSTGEVSISDPPTHAEIASRVATHREAVTRECKHMEEMGLIEWHPGRHVIKDVTALERMVMEVRGR
jgi:CRP-like cAMP-binding protein